MIYTTYFANVKNLPQHVVPVSIAAKTPSWWSGLTYKTLAPKYDMLAEYHATGNEELFAEKYIRGVLMHLTARRVVSELFELANSTDVALVCYEKQDSFCHRQLVAYWLERGGYIVNEFKNSGQRVSATVCHDSCNGGLTC